MKVDKRFVELVIENIYLNCVRVSDSWAYGLDWVPLEVHPPCPQERRVVREVHSPY